MIVGVTGLSDLEIPSSVLWQQGRLLRRETTKELVQVPKCLRSPQRPLRADSPLLGTERSPKKQATSPPGLPMFGTGIKGMPEFPGTHPPPGISFAFPLSHKNEGK